MKQGVNMFRVRIRSGGSILVLGSKDVPLENELNFTEKEYDYAKRLAADLREPGEKEAFWRTLLYKKMDMNYSLYRDFPEVKPDPKTIASGICNMLRKRQAG
jgi:hypothetical protein